MNPWLNDSSPVPNNHGGFGPQVDGSMAFLQPPNTINPAQFQNQNFLNGANRTASPAFQNPMYQTNQVIPSKRSREDSIGASPRQAPIAPPGSRSQTPGQAQFAGFNPAQANGGPNFGNAPPPFQHLHTGNTASPSPTIQQQNFGPPGSVPRVSTASPSPFSPQHGGPQMSPGPGDQNTRVSTPLDNQNFMQQAGFGQGFGGQQFGPGMGNPPPMGMNPMALAQQQMHQQAINPVQRNYQLQMQAQARHLQAQAQAQAQARSTNGMPGNPAPGMPNQQMNPMEQHAMPNPRSNSQEELMRHLQQFMAARGRQVDLTPVIGGRPMPFVKLYTTVMKNGGSVRTTKLNQWPVVASQFGFPPPQNLLAGQEMQNYWMNNVGPYEAAMVTQQQQQQQQRQRMAAQGQLPNQMGPQGGQQPPDPSQLNHVNHQRTPSDMTNLNLNGQMPLQVHPTMNGLAPTREQQDSTPTHRSSLSRQIDPHQVNGMPAPSPSKRPPSSSVKAEPEPESEALFRKPIEDPFLPEVMPPSRYHGPIVVEEMFAIGSQILELKPLQPTIRELGVIDIHSLTMAIKSGMHAETRVALDTLISLSTETSLQLSLHDCEDLMEALVDCAQAQVDLLSENSVEVTDDMSIPSYEELVRACRTETESLQDIAEFGSLAYDLDRAADRLICITTLIRNFSFYEANFGVLGHPEVLQLLTNIIRQLGTKELPLRTYRNTLDFMKDVIIYLSNLSTSLALPGKQEALSLLHFLLAFAPTPPPNLTNSDKVLFTTYNPSLHKYMPSAVDSLAKLLARDEPNRMYYKSLFHADSRAIPAYELLTRTFGLAIAAIPAGSPNFRAIVEARKPFLLQGMLAAEILASLAPGSEHPLARSWLDSVDGFAGSLLRLVSILSSQAHATPRPPPPQPGRGVPPPQVEPDSTGYVALTNRAMAVLKTLVQKAKIVDASGNNILPVHISLRKETLLGAMIQKDIDPAILRQLCSYAGLED